MQQCNKDSIINLEPHVKKSKFSHKIRRGYTREFNNRYACMTDSISFILFQESEHIITFLSLPLNGRYANLIVHK